MPHVATAPVAYGALTRSGRPFQQRSAARVGPSRGVNRPLQAFRSSPTTAPPVGLLAVMVWAPPRSLAATRGIFSFPQGTEMFQFPQCPPIMRSAPGQSPGGLPHSDSPGSPVASTSPGRFAAWPRPSSAVITKASTVRPSSQTSPAAHLAARLAPVRDQSRSPCRRGHDHAPHQGIALPVRRREVRQPRALHLSMCARSVGWSRGDSNPGPPPCKGGALPAKLRPRQTSATPLRGAPSDRSLNNPPRRLAAPVGAPGLEPGTSALSGPRSNQLSYAPLWLALVDAFRSAKGLPPANDCAAEDEVSRLT
jgi:hypothetical protein